MPIDTAPLSTPRRLLALLVLLLMLGGSLALAQYIVVARDFSFIYKDGANVVFSPPPGFTVQTHDLGGNPDRWKMPRTPAPISIMRVDGSLARIDGINDRPAFFEAMLKEEITVNEFRGDPPVLIPFDKAEAKLFIGRDESGAAVMAVGGAMIRDHTVYFVLSCQGAPITDEDLAVFKRTFAHATVTLDGQPYAPVSATTSANTPASTPSPPAKGPNP
jgi:hypothetical protein